MWFFLSSLTAGSGPPARAAIGSSGPAPGPYTHQGRAARRERRGPGVKLTAGGAGSAEGVSAGAGAARVRVVDREALLLDRVREVDRGPCQVRHAHLVDDHFHATERTDGVAIEFSFVEVQLVDQAGTAPRLYRDPQSQVVTSLLVEQCFDLAGGSIGQGNFVTEFLRGGSCLRHLQSPRLVRTGGPVSLPAGSRWLLAGRKVLLLSQPTSLCPGLHDPACASPQRLPVLGCLRARRAASGQARIEHRVSGGHAGAC